MRQFYNHEISGELINVDIVNALIYSLYNLLGKYSDKHYTGLYYGYYEVKTLERRLSILYDILDNLRNLKFRLGSDSDCACDEDTRKFVENTRQLVDGCSDVRIDLITDSSGYDEWVLLHPDRVVREVWEECLYRKCDNISYKLVRDLNDAKKECKVVYDLVKAINECKVQYQFVDKTKDCQIEYNLLVTKHNCKLSYDEYIQIHNCGGSFDLVKSATECGATIGVSLKSQCLEVTYQLNKYTINCYE